MWCHCAELILVVAARSSPGDGRATVTRATTIVLGLVALLVAASCGSQPPATLANEPSWPSVDLGPAPRTIDGLSQLASIDGQTFSVHTNSGDLTFLPGVNLGSSVPGHAPGELAVTAEHYREWFPQIVDAGFRVLRVYTILPPYFYEEFAAFNEANPENPLYLAHGIWVPEEHFYEARDLWNPLVRDAFHAEIHDAVGAVNGDAEIAPLIGHADGIYTVDVSPWLISWIVGVELDPEIVHESEAVNGDRSFDGEFFFATDNASSTEVWLAEGMNLVAQLQAENGRMVPQAFVNWPTTDPLVHPDEPLETEDLVGVDANHVLPHESWSGGVFASYHAYPYYPDFQRYEAGIVDFELNGRPDPYAGYLTKLRDHHSTMPTMVTEFGVPSGIGSAHYGPLDRNQGGHSEQTQMEINAELMQVIADLGLAGGYVFAWTDEWFKFTWNTIDFELPGDRRAMWMNPYTNEAHFGLVAMEPGTSPTVVVDGRPDEWNDNGSQVLYEGRDHVREVRARHDEGFVYLLLRFDERDVWEAEPVTVGFDVIDGGAGQLPSGTPDLTSDYAVVFGSDGEASLLTAGHSDPYRRFYGAHFEFFDQPLDELEIGAGSWAPQTLITNRPLWNPLKGEVEPAETVVVGALVRGTSDPTDERFDSRTAWEGRGEFLELRLPYQGIGFSDPSSRLASVIDLDGRVTTEPVDHIGLVVEAGGQTYSLADYSWETWQSVTWHERPKRGIEAVSAVSRTTEQAGFRVE